MLSSHLILCFPLLLLPSVFPSFRIFSDEPALCIRWPKYWSFRFSISPSTEYSGLISFRIDWFGLLIVQGLSRVFSSTTVQKHQFLGTHGSTLTSGHDYWINHSFDYTYLCQQSDVSAFKILLSRFVIAFLPKSKVKWSEVAQSCLTLCVTMDCSLQGSSVHGIFQARILEWVAISFSRGYPYLGIKPRSPPLLADALLSEPAGKPKEWASFNFMVAAIVCNTKVIEILVVLIK